MRALALVSALVLAAAATAQDLPSAPLDGHRADLDRFAGEWVGGYACEETGRQGTITFRLGAGADSVAASILMVPRPTAADPVPDPIPLGVHHVEITGRSLRGTLAPYDDPEWGLPLETSFGGALARDDHIEGYFRVEGTRIDTVPQCGRWWATRVADNVEERPPGRPVH